MCIVIMQQSSCETTSTIMLTWHRLQIRYQQAALLAQRTKVSGAATTLHGEERIPLAANTAARQHILTTKAQSVLQCAVMQHPHI